MSAHKIKTILISVFYKDGLDEILPLLKEQNVKIVSTGGTLAYIESQGIPVTAVEDLTGYPSILGGRVKTLHPKIFGGFLAKRAPEHLSELEQFEIPQIDAVVVDLYPFEETVASTSDEEAIIEKIDIGGIALIRGAAKNFKDVVVIPSKADYSTLATILKEQNGISRLEQRKALAQKAFLVSSRYDRAIEQYFLAQNGAAAENLNINLSPAQELRYGENPHQSAEFYGSLEGKFEILGGKSLSFNNLVDVDAAMMLMADFKNDDTTFAILKHTNACGIATRSIVFEAWEAALAGDPISAFGGIFICNRAIDVKTAEAINEVFYEVLIAPDFDPDALSLLQKKKKRILLRAKDFEVKANSFKSLLNGAVRQDTDLKVESGNDLKVVTKKEPTAAEVADLLFANKCAKHLKSNTIVIAKNQQLLGMGCGQTSRIDACHQAIAKAHRLGFDTEGAVMASDAFFPFPDCVEVADEHGIKTVIQPGGSINDQLSIDFCDAHDMAMVTTGIRHFKH